MLISAECWIEYKGDNIGAGVVLARQCTQSWDELWKLWHSAHNPLMSHQPWSPAPALHMLPLYNNWRNICSQIHNLFYQLS